jgi:hypothetical protein
MATAKAILVGGHVYVPEKAPSAFHVGPGTWLPDETHLEVRRGDDYPDSIYVGATDSQIMFPPAERWVRRDAWRRIIDEKDIPV